jgi:hypothetical protein
MAYDLSRVRAELEGAGVQRALPFEVAIAVVNDTFRQAGLVPPRAAQWKTWAGKQPKLKEQAPFLAHALVATSLRAQTVEDLERARPDPSEALSAFFEALAMHTLDMLKGNRFRQEEFLRRWVACLAGSVAGESAAQSKKKLEQLDYRTTLADYRKTEAARAKEAERRAQLLREAAQREEYAKGWRE